MGLRLVHREGEAGLVRHVHALHSACRVRDNGQRSDEPDAVNLRPGRPVQESGFHPKLELDPYAEYYQVSRGKGQVILMRSGSCTEQVVNIPH